MQLGVENGSKTSLIKAFSEPQSVRSVPIKIEIQSDKVVTNFVSAKNVKTDDPKIVDKSKGHKREVPIKTEPGNCATLNSTSPSTMVICYCQA